MRLLSVLPFLGILITAAAAAEHSKKRIELAMPLIVFFFALSVYVSGLFDNLLPGLFVCWAVVLLSLAYVLRLIVKKRFDPKLVFTPGLCFLVAVFAFGLFVHRRETLIGWDESAHWILTLRNSIALNRFGAVAPSSAQYKTYPPIVAMFHYFFTKTSIVYANTTVRMSVTVITAAMLAPLLSVFDRTKKGRVYAAFAGVILFALPFVYFKNAYFGAQVDCIQGLVPAAVLAVYILTDAGRLGRFTAVAGLCFLTLTKDSGLILALIASAVLACDRLFFASSPDPLTGKRRLRLTDALAALLLLLLPLLAKASWTFFLYAHDIAEEATDQLDFWMIDYVKSILSGRFRDDYARSYRVQGFVQFWRSVLYDASFHENTRFWLAGCTVPYSVRLCFSALLMALAVRCAEQRKRTAVSLAILFAGNLVWLCGISVLYLCRFTEPENAVLSSVSRYLGTGLVVMDVVSLAFLARPFAWLSAAQAHSAKRRRVLAVLLAAVLTLPSLSVLFSERAYDNYKGRALLCFAETERDRTYDAYMAEFTRIGAYLTRDDAVLIVAAPQSDGTLWYKHALPPLQRVEIADAAEVTPEQLHGRTMLYLFPDQDADAAAARFALPAGTLERGALYRVSDSGDTITLERVL